VFVAIVVVGVVVVVVVVVHVLGPYSRCRILSLSNAGKLNEDKTKADPKSGGQKTAHQKGNRQ